MILSDAIRVHRPFAEWRRVVSMKNSIEAQWTWHHANDTGLTKTHARRRQYVLDLIDDYLAERRDRHAINSLLSSRGMVPKSTRSVLDWIFCGLPAPGKAQHDEFTAALYEEMTTKAREARRSMYQFQITCELAHRCNAQGWYPLFNTLTVNKWDYDAVFCKGSNLFRNYIDKIDRAVARAIWGSIENAPSTERWHTYMAVVEEGPLHGRQHIHIIHFLRALPLEARDPNRGRARPYLREVSWFKNIWDHGHTTPLAVRWSHDDPYGRLGWRWPLDPQTGEGIEAGSPYRCASYMADYVAKAYGDRKRSKHLWRTRKTRHFGNQIPDQLVDWLSERQLQMLATNPLITANLNQCKVPQPSLRLAAMRRLCLLSSTNPEEFDFLAMAKRLTPQPPIVQRLRASDRRSHEHNSASSTPSIARVSANEGMDSAATSRLAYSTWAAVQTAALTLDRKYFLNPTTPKARPSFDDF